MYDVIIVGSGSAGYTSAIYTSRAGLKTLVVTGETIGGLLTTTTLVENFPGFKTPVNGKDLMYDMKEQAIGFGADICDGVVTSIEETFDFSEEYLINISTNGKSISYKTSKIILASGSSPKKIELNNIESLTNNGYISYCATCDGFFSKGKNVVVIGGGDTAFEEAMYLSNICESVTVLVRGESPKASKIMVNRANKNDKITILYNSEIKEVIELDESITIITNNNFVIDEINSIFVCIGHQPNTSYLNDNMKQNMISPHGTIRVNSENETFYFGIYAAGDVVDHKYRQAIVAAGDGCKTAMNVINQTLKK